MPRWMRRWLLPVLAGLVCVTVAAGLGLTALHEGDAAANGAGSRPSPPLPTESAIASPAISASPTSSTTPSASPSASASPEASPLNATVAFAGDVLLHLPVDADAKTAKGYDFGPLLKGVTPWISGADIAICQLEVPLAAPGRPLSGYPVFGAPKQIIPGLAKQGWDGCATATNHSLDQGWAGIKTTVGALTSNHMGYAGMALNQKDADDAQLYRLTLGDQTLTVAHLSTAYGFNGFKLPKAEPWAVAKNNVSQIVKRAKAARKAGADIVLLSVHFGVEYNTKTTADQRDFVKKIAASGAVDAVIGGHPHVPEPIEKVKGGVGGKGMWVAYSLGNFICDMDSALKNTGIVAYVHLTKDADGARVTGMTWSTVVVDRRHGHRLFMTQDAKPGKSLGHLSAAELKSRHTSVIKIVGKTAKEQKAPPKPSGAKLKVLGPTFD